MIDRVFSLLTASVALLVSSYLPCNVPVFRYALERWPSDDYQLVVYHDSSLASLNRSGEQLLEQLEASATPPAPTNGRSSIKNLNLSVVRIDVHTQAAKDDVESASLFERWKTEYQPKSVKLPFVELRSSTIAGQHLTVWKGAIGELRSINLERSPIREQISRKLLRGDAVVWLVVKSSQADKNREILKMLEDKNKALAGEIELPDGIGLPGSELYSEVPLLLEFSTVQIARDDQQESILLNLIRSLEPEAFERDELLLMPIFGRGRALEVIPASRVDAGLIGDLTAFLCGACSCQVKERNPGFDLLLAVDWQQKLFGDGPLPPPPDTGLGTQKSGPTLRQIPSGKPR